MTDIGTAGPRLQTIWQWWQSLDAGMQDVLERIAAQAPDAVANVIAGPDAALIKPQGGKTLAEQLWAAVSRSIPTRETGGYDRLQIRVTGVEFSVTNPPGGMPVALMWKELPIGGQPARGEQWRAKAIVQDETGAIVTHAETAYAPSSREASRELTIPGIPDGRYWIKLFVPYEDGVESAAGAEVVPAMEWKVGRADAGAVLGAASPADRFRDASYYLGQAAASAGQGDGAAAAASVDSAVALVNSGLQMAGSSHEFRVHTGSLTAEGIDLRYLADGLTRASVLAGVLADKALAALAAGKDPAGLTEFSELERGLYPDAIVRGHRMEDNAMAQESQLAHQPGHMQLPRDRYEVGQEVQGGVVVQVGEDSVLVRSPDGTESWMELY